MKRWPNWIAIVITAAFVFTGLALTGCGGSSGTGDAVDATGMLRRVRNAAELETSLKAGLRAARPGAFVPTASGQDRFSGTYTQEADVDEFDAVRYDGTHLYVAPQRAMVCCFVGPTGNSPNEPSPDPARAIRILRTDPSSGTAAQVGSIPLEESVSVQGLYVTAGRAIALTSEAFFGSFGEFWTMVPYWAPTDFGVRIFDVSNPAEPRETFSAKMDGVFVESRRIGDRIYLISRYTPNALLDPNRLVDTIPLGELLPQVTINGVTRPLVEAAQCYVTNEGKIDGYPIITTITVISIQNPQALTSTCYNEESVGVYVSERALYVTQHRSIPTPQTQSTVTRIHKFALSGDRPSYVGSAEIPGAIWSGGQNDFRMSEYNELLRVMTTEFVSDSTDSTDNHLYILRQRATAPELEVVSQLPNSRRPEEIGKPNESLYGVRFLGNRAFAVTFRRIDPLYAIDLADPADPRIAGQLEVPGFSDFLHPVTDNLLLGLGESEPGQVKLELFDVTELDRPSSRGAVVFGEGGSYSEARYDRHAFTYLADVNGVDRFAIPVFAYSSGVVLELLYSGLHLFEIHAKQTPAVASLQGVGAIIPRGADGKPLPPAGRNRAFLHGDTVYYVTDEQVWSASWLLPSRVNGPY